MNATASLAPPAEPVPTAGAPGSAPAIANAAVSPRRSAWRRLASEPMLHFVVLGGLVFALDHLLWARRGDPYSIEVPVSAYQEARGLIKSGMNREATDADLKILIDRWVDNEVLYREGLALSLDKGDAAIRDRVIFKALGVAQAGLVLPAYDDKMLKAWFEAHHASYDTPARFDFLEAVVAGEPSRERLQAFVDSLNGRGQSDVESSLNVFKDRPRSNLVGSFGEAFAAALEQAKPSGEWLLLTSATGLRVVRLQQLKPAEPARYEGLKDRVLQDWKDETMAQLTTREVRQMGRKYSVLRQGEAR
jgi:hypothetical protein